MPASDRSPALRLRQGFVLLLGAVVFAVLVGDGGESFFWTPLGIGLAYLAAAVAGGRQGAYWAGALVLCGWGAAVLYVREARPEDLDVSGLYLAGAGLGALAAVAVQRAGVRADALGATATVLVAGLLLTFSAQWSALTEARTYALFAGAVGLLNVVWGAVAARER
jgi:hypothetical protein